MLSSTLTGGGAAGTSGHFADIREYAGGRAQASCICGMTWPTRSDWLTAYDDLHIHEVATGVEHCECGMH